MEIIWRSSKRIVRVWRVDFRTTTTAHYFLASKSEWNCFHFESQEAKKELNQLLLIREAEGKDLQLHSNNTKLELRIQVTQACLCEGAHCLNSYG